jgi:hypothetical protein
MDSIASVDDSIVGLCKHCDELFGTIRGRDFFLICIIINFSRQCHGISIFCY